MGTLRWETWLTLCVYTDVCMLMCSRVHIYICVHADGGQRNLMVVLRH